MGVARLCSASLLFAICAAPVAQVATDEPYYANISDFYIDGDEVFWDGSQDDRGCNPSWVIVADSLGICAISQWDFRFKRRCMSPSRISLPKTLRIVRNGAFRDGSLRRLDFGGGLDSIGDGAFAGNRLRSVHLPNCPHFGVDCFAANQIQSFEWPSCEVRNFSGMAGNYLERVSVPHNVKSLGAFAFAGNPLKEVAFHDGIDTIGKAAFMDNYIINVDTVFASTLNSVVLPQGLRLLGNACFMGQKSLRHVVFNDSLAHIGASAFSWCASLDSVTIPDRVSQICVATFRECESLSMIRLPTGIDTIGGLAFFKCKNLADANLPQSLRFIGEYAFAQTRVNSLKIPGAVKSLSKFAFANCSYGGDAEIVFDVGVEEICDSAFYCDIASTSTTARQDSVTLSLPSSIRRLGQCAFHGVALRHVQLPTHDEAGDDIAWNAYFNGASRAADVTSIGGYDWDFRSKWEYRAVKRTENSLRQQKTDGAETFRIYDFGGRLVYAGRLSDAPLPKKPYVAVGARGGGIAIQKR